MNPGKVTTFARSDTPLGANEVYLSDWIQVGTDTLMKQIPGGGFGAIRGFVNSDVDGQLDVFQAYDLTDISGITTAVPAAGVSDGALGLSPYAFASTGATNPGTPYSDAIVMPFVRVRYTNGAAPQTSFRLNFDVVE